MLHSPLDQPNLTRTRTRFSHLQDAQRRLAVILAAEIVGYSRLIERIEKGEEPLLAAYKGARQVGFAVIATTAVLLNPASKSGNPALSKSR